MEIVYSMPGRADGPPPPDEPCLRRSPADTFGAVKVTWIYCRAAALAALVALTGGAALPVAPAWAADKPAPSRRRSDRAAQAAAEALARSHYEKGARYFEIGDYAKALEEFKAAFNAKPDPALMFNVAQCHRKLKNFEAALDLYNRYLYKETDPRRRATVEKLVDDTKRERDATLAAAAAPPVTPRTTTAAGQVPPGAAIGLATQPPAVAPTPLWKNHWVWIGVGAVAAGTVAALVLTRKTEITAFVNCADCQREPIPVPAR